MLARSLRSGAHALPFGRLAGLCAAVSLGGAAFAQTPLENYDAAITADAAGGLTPVAKLASAVTLTGAGGAAFDFGASTDDGTIEFILEGDPAANISAYLAVGEVPASSLRYELWNNTGQVGFTQAGVADYQFIPGVVSPKKGTHLAYVWDPVNGTMMVYVNGIAAGTVTGVDPAFVLPAGQGWLGAAANGAEAMVGTIHRVTVYDTILTEAAIARHADAYNSQLKQALAAYDAAVTADAGAGLTPLTKLTSPVLLGGTAGAEFDFGASADDVTIEFLLEGDPSFNISAFLAVGEGSDSSLRYELWENTAQLGFTQLRVADYAFVPGVPSPTLPTHVAYVWNAATLTMKAYVNGSLAGTVENVSANFVMPAGLGWLGSNATGAERMVGTIYRITIYDDVIADDAVLRHARAFTDLLRPPSIISFTANPSAMAAGETATLNWEVQNTTKVFINGIEQTGSSLAVSPSVSAGYTLTAQNSLGSTTAKLRVTVNPPLAAYDAAINADAAGGLTPLAKLTTGVALAGTGGVPFDFGATSGDTTIEFIVEGDPTEGSATYLAVGENPDSNLRYENWNNTQQYGFTQLRVADYLFTPPVPCSTWPTHLTFVWDATALTVKVYVNGTLAGSTLDVSPLFVMPSGLGTLGSNPAGGEAMVGTIQRVTVYNGQVSETAILRHARAFLGEARPALNGYDVAVDTSAAGGLMPLARLLAPVTLTGVGGVPFNFGASVDDATMEFILEGDPSANSSAFLAVGVNDASSLRYEVWFNTGELGFTQAAVADYQFAPGVPSPGQITHIAYAWDAAAATMNLFVNGLLAGTTTGVDAAFGLPQDLGWLGNNAGGTEPMVGTIHRVTVYDELLSDAVILAHAQAFANVGQPPQVSLDLRGALPSIVLSQGVSGLHYRVEYRNSLAPADTWQLLADIPALIGTTARVEDPMPWASRTQRYYRAVQVP